MTRTIVVLGATGGQGGSVVDKFLQDSNWSVRGVTRNTSSGAAKKLASRGVEIVQGDLDDPQSLVSAFSGSHAIFAVTDFWATYISKYPEKRDSTNDRELGEYAYNAELVRGKAIADAAAQVLEKEGKLEIFVWSSLAAVTELSGGNLTYVYHFDGKAAIERYIRESLPELDKKMSTVQIGWYANNWNGDMFKPQKQSDGKWLWKNTGSATSPRAWVDARRDTGLFVSLLVNSEPGKQLLGCSDMISMEKFLEHWTEILGTPSKYQEVSVDDLVKTFGPALGKEIGESSIWATKYGWAGGVPAVLMPKDIDPNVKTTTMAEYISNEDWTPLFGEDFKKPSK